MLIHRIIRASRPESFIIMLLPLFLSFVLAIDHLQKGLAILTLLCAMAGHIATNLAGEYYDYIQGHDTVATKPNIAYTAYNPQAIKNCFIIALALYTVLAIKLLSYAPGGLYILCPIALLSAIATIWYSKGEFSIAKICLGELFVVIFFGFVPVVGSYYLHMGKVTMDTSLKFFGIQSLAPFIIGLGCGMIANIVLTLNNIRDMQEDKLSGKSTLVVRLGRSFGLKMFKWSWFIVACTIFASVPSLLSLGSATLFALQIRPFIKNIKKDDYNRCFSSVPFVAMLYFLLVTCNLAQGFILFLFVMMMNSPQYADAIFSWNFFLTKLLYLFQEY